MNHARLAAPPPSPTGRGMSREARRGEGRHGTNWSEDCPHPGLFLDARPIGLALRGAVPLPPVGEGPRNCNYARNFKVRQYSPTKMPPMTSLPTEIEEYRDSQWHRDGEGQVQTPVQAE